MRVWSARRAFARVLAAASLGFALTGYAHAAVAVWTQHNDNNRSGDNLSETILTPSNVNQAQFGALFNHTLDDQSFSQPLYIPNLTMAVDGAVHNVVFVATVNDSVYAFDADSGTANGGNPLWHVNLAPSGATVPSNANMSTLGACGGTYTDFTGKFGIVGTPVIDTSTNTLYVVARTIESNAYVQRLHALDCTSGAEKFGGPVVISGTFSGSAFSPELNNQRPALALANGVVYIGWASHCDFGAYHGFVMGYNASNLNQVAVWSTTNSSGSQGGIWQGGQGLAIDGSNNIYFMSGNGTWDGDGNYGESFVKLAGGSLTVQDYFTPNNWSTLNGGDVDLGSAGCLLIPGTTYAFGGGKSGMVYLVNTANMGHENSTDQAVQEFQATFPPSGDTGHIHGGPVYFNNGTSSYVYLWGENDYCRAFQFNGSSFTSSAVGLSTMKSPTSNTGMPGGFLSISSNGTSNGILWATTPYNGDANHGTVPGILHAFNATPSGGALTELWNSQQNATRDSYGNYAKYSYPTIANGKVYVSTFGTATSGSGGLWVYGELPSTAPAAPTGLAALAGSGSVTLTWTASAGATTYNVYRGTTSGGEGTTPLATGVTGTAYTDSTPVNGTTYYYTLAAVSANGTSPQSTQVSATPASTSGSGFINIDSGGAASGSFVADVDFSGGTATSATNAIDTSLLTGSIPPQAVLQSNRYGTFAYTIPGLTANTVYGVTLYFAEEYWTAAGKRTFNVVANGTTELSNFDIFAAAGAEYKAVQKSFNVATNASGQIVLNFNSVIDNAQVNAIVIGNASTGGSAPSTPTGLSAVAGNTQVALSWTASSGATSYNVYRATTSGGEGTTAIATGITGTTYTNTGLTDGTKYYYTVAAVNGSGTSAQSTEASATPVAGAPAAPTGLTAAAGNAQVVLTWAASSGATSYNVYRATTSGGEGTTAIATGITGTTYTNTGLTDGTKYYYTVAAVNSSGTSAQSTEASATPEPGAPAAPTGLTAAGGNAQVALAWTTSSGATSYSVYRGTTSGGESTTALASGLTSTSYTDTTVTNGTTYYYTVKALNAGGTSAVSNEASATPMSTVSTGGISINCGGSAASPFVADTDYTGGSSASVANTITTTQLTGTIPPQAVLQSNRYGTFTYTIPGLTAGSAYPITLYFAEEYWTASGKRVFDVSINGTQVLTNFDIYATAGAEYAAVQKSFTATANASGQIVISTTNVTDNAQINGIVIGSGSGSAGTAPPPPNALSAAAGSGQVTLTWTAMSGATSYNVYRGTTAGGESSTAIASGITGTTYSDTSVTNGTTYYYKVASVNSYGTSAMSLEASATPQASTTSILIDCGGAASGSWLADTDYSGGATASVTNTINTSLLTGTIPPQTVLDSNRYGTFTYTIPGLTAGSSHTVTLYFAEEYWTAAGKRVFNVSINSTAVLSSFDIYATAGAEYKAVQKSFTATANSSGQIVITTTNVTDNAQINGIAVN